MPKMTDSEEHRQFKDELNRLGFYWRAGEGWFHTSGRQIKPPREEAEAMSQELGIAYVSACRRLLIQRARKIVRSL